MTPAGCSKSMTTARSPWPAPTPRSPNRWITRTGNQDYEIQVSVKDRTTDGLTDEDRRQRSGSPTSTNRPSSPARPCPPSTRMPTSATGWPATPPQTRRTAPSPGRWRAPTATTSPSMTSGNLRFASQPDHEAQPTHSITIVATDDGDDPKKGEFPVTVEVTDVNESPLIYLGARPSDFRRKYSHKYCPAQLRRQRPGGRHNHRSPGLWVELTPATSRSTTAASCTFKNAPDYERPADSGGNNVYNVQVRASDGSLTGTKDVTVTVQDLNEAPVVTGDDTLSYPENTAVTNVLDRYNATDPERGQITWSLSGTDRDDFRVDPSGNLYFAAPPDLDAPGSKNSLEVTVEATDDGTLGDRTLSSRGTETGNFDVTVTVTPVDEPPVITGTTTFSMTGRRTTTAPSTPTPPLTPRATRTSPGPWAARTGATSPSSMGSSDSPAPPTTSARRTPAATTTTTSPSRRPTPTASGVNWKSTSSSRTSTSPP